MTSAAMTQVLAPTPDSMDRAARTLKSGGLIVLPTETVYGLAADATQQAAVRGIYALKGRPPDHPLIVHVANLALAQRWGVLDARAIALAQAFWPGPLTLIVPRQPQAPGWACGGQSSIGLRCPSHPVALAVLERFAMLDALGGVAAPSANRFGRVSPTRVQHVLDDLGADTPLVLDGGPCDVGVESTIVDLTGEQPRLLRPGRIRRDEIEAVLGTPLAGQDAHAPRASGTLASHYCPVTPVSVVDEDTLDASLIATDWAPGRIGVFSRRRPSVPHACWLPAPSDAIGWEQSIYDAMRTLDREGLDRILIAAPREGAHWDAIVDRVSRAGVRS